jgi:hypothetical protein
VSAINAYLAVVFHEAEARGYRFDRRKVGPVRRPPEMVVTDGQLAFEMAHLRRKLEVRNRATLARIDAGSTIRPHPLFTVIRGPIESWERGAR